MGIAGKYTFATSDKYSEYLKEVGVNMLNRTLANNTKPTMEYIEHGDGKWTQKIITTIKNFEFTFVPGKEFVETLADDRLANSTITIEGNKLIHKQNIGDKYTAVTTREFGDTEMKTTFTSGGVTAVRTFKRV